MHAARPNVFAREKRGARTVTRGTLVFAGETAELSNTRLSWYVVEHR